MRDKDARLIWEAFDFHNPVEGIFNKDLYEIWTEEYYSSGPDDFDREWEPYEIWIKDERIYKNLFTKEEVDLIKTGEYKHGHDFHGRVEITRVIYKGDKVQKGMNAEGNVSNTFHKRNDKGKFATNWGEEKPIRYQSRGKYLEDHISWASSDRARMTLRGLR